jgi:hypothetical protein
MEEKARLLEFAAMQAAQEDDNPVLARSLHVYRTRHRLSIEQLIHWLGLQTSEDFYRLALCLKPSRLHTPLDWRDYTLTIKERFPSLNLKRLRLVVETENKI